MPNPNKPKIGATAKLVEEMRSMNCRLVTVRASKREDDESDQFVYIEGKAVTFNDETVLFKYNGIEYKEVILPEAFEDADCSDVVVKYNHSDAFLAVARTRNKTLELDIREDGVYVTIKIRKDNPNGMQFYKNVEEGLIDRMSFSFVIREDNFDEKEHKWTVRKIEKVYDVAAVDFPAYENTEIYAKRFGDAEALRAELESRKRREEEETLARHRAKVKALLNVQ